MKIIENKRIWIDIDKKEKNILKRKKEHFHYAASPQNGILEKINIRLCEVFNIIILRYENVKIHCLPWLLINCLRLFEEEYSHFDLWNLRISQYTNAITGRLSRNVNGTRANISVLFFFSTRTTACGGKRLAFTEGRLENSTMEKDENSLFYLHLE